MGLGLQKWQMRYLPSEILATLTGHVSWDEYKIKFLASKGFNEKEVAEKVKNNEELKIDEESKWLAREPPFCLGSCCSVSSGRSAWSPGLLARYT